MKLSYITEAKDKNFFDYSDLSDDMWHKKVKEEQERSSINFNLENDYDVSQREIIIPQETWEHTKCKFKCELYSAGGDWEQSIYYFRCQLRDGYADGLNKNSCFIYIPPHDGGNTNLVKSDNGYTAATDDLKNNKPSESKAWASLKEHLAKLVHTAERNH